MRCVHTNVFYLMSESKHFRCKVNSRCFDNRPPYWWTTDRPLTSQRRVKHFCKLTQKRCSAQTWELEKWFMYCLYNISNGWLLLWNGFEFVLCCMTMKIISTCVHCRMLFWQYCCYRFAIPFLRCCFSFFFAISVKQNTFVQTLKCFSFCLCICNNLNSNFVIEVAVIQVPENSL